MKKTNYIDKTTREIVHSIFYVDERYQLDTIIQAWFKKMKPLPVFSRLFQDYNKRYFILNLKEIALYYSPRQTSSLEDITFIPFEEIREIRDKPHYALSNQGVEWKEAFGFTIYFQDKYMVLVAQCEQIYNQWLCYFEAIRFKRNGESVLTRTRTAYISLGFPKAVTSVKTLEEEFDQLPEAPPHIEQYVQNALKNTEIRNIPESKSENNILAEFPEVSPTLLKIVNKESKKNQELNDDQNKGMISNQFEENAQEEFQETEPIQLKTNLIQVNGKDEETESNQRMMTEIEDIMEVAISNELNTDIPKRLDQKKGKLKEFVRQESLLKKNITDIWGQFDKEGNKIVKPIALKSNFVEEPQSLFLQQSQLIQDEVDQPEFLIRFDEINDF